MLSYTLEGTERKSFRTKQTKELRRKELVPCNLYGGDDHVHFYAPYGDFIKLVYNPEFFTVKVKVNDKEYNTIIKDIQFHPVTDAILHIDFLELVPSKKIIADIPVHLIGGVPVGVKDGGVLRHKVRKLHVKTLPKYLVDKIEVNVENLEKGESIKVEDLDLEGMEVLTSHYIPVATVAVPRALELPELEVEEAEGEEGEEGEGAEAAEGGEAKEGGEGEEEKAEAEKSQEGEG